MNITSGLVLGLAVFGGIASAAPDGWVVVWAEHEMPPSRTPQLSEAGWVLDPCDGDTEGWYRVTTPTVALRGDGGFVLGPGPEVELRFVQAEDPDLPVAEGYSADVLTGPDGVPRACLMQSRLWVAWTSETRKETAWMVEHTVYGADGQTLIVCASLLHSRSPVGVYAGMHFGVPGVSTPEELGERVDPGDLDTFTVDVECAGG